MEITSDKPVTTQQELKFLVHDLLLAIQVPTTPKQERDAAQERLRSLCKYAAIAANPILYSSILCPTRP